MAEAATPLSDSYNRTTFSLDGTAGGGFPHGSNGAGYSVEALQAAGLQNGGTLSVDGFDYQLPTVGAGRQDTLYPGGEELSLPPVTHANRIGILAASGYGNTSVNMTVHYTDGSESTANLGVTDWWRSAEWNGAPNGARTKRTVEAARFAYANDGSGSRTTQGAYWFSTSAQIDDSKTVEWAKFTPGDSAWPYIYSVALASGDPKPLEQSFNENSIGAVPTGGQGDAEFGVDRWAFSQASLADSGITAGTSVSAGDMTYTWPTVADGAPDNLDWWGQRVAVDAVAGATHLGFVAAAPGGPAFARTTIGYADGTTGNGELVVSDWVLGDMDPPSTGNTILTTMRTRLSSDGTQDYPTRLFSVEVPVDPSRQPVWIQAETPWADAIHVFAMSSAIVTARTPDTRLPGTDPVLEPVIPEIGEPWADTPLVDVPPVVDPAPVAPVTPAPSASAAQAPTPQTPAPAPAATAVGEIARATVVVPRTLRLDARGGIALRLRCAKGADCRVRATVAGRDGQLGRSALVTVSEGRTVSVRVALSPAARRAVARRGALAVRIAAGGANVSAVVRPVARSARR
ncbi:hypothetical protein [Conexibacter sp. CPCC 206217]|uniref:hypothetical protein n=1 Tax=Conexibacter sp. CPCC 206217 TaxID=3064574 RepID=UPI002720F2F1|nr:hypothetical protein [Conexibacter sp. CPCC 206217]MDO8208799.1 hypothetical protein [Conexibacter sp. CPCC 206217]